MSEETKLFERIIFGRLANPRERAAKIPITACARLFAELRQAEAKVAELEEKLRTFEQAEKAA